MAKQKAPRVTVPKRKANQSAADHLLDTLEKNSAQLARNIAINAQQVPSLQKAILEYSFRDRTIVVPGVTPEHFSTARGQEQYRAQVLFMLNTGAIGLATARELLDLSIQHNDRLIQDDIEKMKRIARGLIESRHLGAMEIDYLDVTPPDPTVEAAEPSAPAEPEVFVDTGEPARSPDWLLTKEERRKRNVKQTAKVIQKPAKEIDP